MRQLRGHSGDPARAFLTHGQECTLDVRSFRFGNAGANFDDAFRAPELLHSSWLPSGAAKPRCLAKCA